MPTKRFRVTRSTALLAATAAVGALTAAPAQAVTGTPVTDQSHAYTARLVIGEDERACSGALVDPQWVISAGSCFVDNPAEGVAPPAGKPAKTVTVTVGRSDLASATGLVTTVTELVPAPGRDLVMARLAQPATNVTPIALSTQPPAAGDTVKAAGFGRTRTEWAPLKLHTGDFTVDSLDAGQLAITGQDGDAICPGDAGGPLFREKDGKTELVAVNSKSWQGGCWGIDETEQRTGAVSTRVDDLTAWIHQVRSLPQQAQITAGDFDGDGKSDVAALYDYGKNAQGRAQSSLWVFKSDGTSFRAPSVAWDSGTGSWTWDRSKLTSGDYNGDGKTDVGVLYDYGVTDGKANTKLWVFTSTGDGFQAPKVAWDSGATSWTWARSQLTSGDFTGDGKTDVGILYNNGTAADGRFQTKLWVIAGTGDGFQAPKVVWDNGTGSWNWERSQLTSGDFNGDGKTDVGVLYDYGVTDGKANTKLWTFTSTGDGFQAPKVTWDSGATSWTWTRSKLTTGDYDGDGKTDVGILYDYGVTDGKANTKLWVIASTGTGFQAPKVAWDSGATSWTWARSQAVSGDAGGDGKADLAVFYDNGTTADGRTRHALWNLTSTGDSMAAPHRDWDSALS